MASPSIPFALPTPPAALVRLVGNPLLARVMDLMTKRHEAVFTRLAGQGCKRVQIEPQGLPVAFLLTLASPQQKTRLELTEPGMDDCHATIRGPLRMLVDLLEGRLDGDALFFSRALTIEGDTEVIVALRNAIDGEEIDLADDLASLLGPFAGPAAQAIRRAKTFVLGREQAS